MIGDAATSAIRATAKLAFGLRASGPVSDRALRLAMRGALATYRALLSPLLRRHCLFQPSCSRYASQVLRSESWNRARVRVLRQYCDCCGDYDIGVRPDGTATLRGRSGFVYTTERIAPSVLVKLSPAPGAPPLF